MGSRPRDRVKLVDCVVAASWLENLPMTDPTRLLGSEAAPGPRGAGGASPLAGVRSRFLSSLGDAEQRHVFDLAVRMARDMHAWAATYPLIRRVRVWPLALSVAAAAPFSDAEALTSTARLSLWVFTLDDLFDEEGVPQPELMRRAERYRHIAQFRDVPTRSDSLAAALRDVRDDLARYPLFAELGAGWARALGGTIDGMIEEYAWRLEYLRAGALALPSYERYIETGLSSIGGPPHIWASWITVGDPSTPLHLDLLRGMEREASICIRLANDLQSQAKEVAEGNVNALVILGHRFRERGAESERAGRLAEAAVRRAIARGLARLSALQATTATETGQPESATAAIARFVCDFYVEHDYHTFVQQAR